MNREHCLLSAAVNYAHREWDWQLRNRVAGRKRKEPGTGQVAYPGGSRGPDPLCGAGGHAAHLADFIRLALNTGCRKQELLVLERRRVDL